MPDKGKHKHRLDDKRGVIIRKMDNGKDAAQQVRRHKR